MGDPASFRYEYVTAPRVFISKIVKNAFYNMPKERVRYPADLLFDEVDWPIIGQHSWKVYRDGFVFTNIGGKHVQLHRLLVKPGKKRVEHINGNKLDCRRENLMVV